MKTCTVNLLCTDDCGEKQIEIINAFIYLFIKINNI